MIDSKFKKTLWGVKHRGGMYFSPTGYWSLRNFLVGYGLAKKEDTKENILDGFQTWLNKKIGTYSPIHWSSYIFEKMANNDEEKAQKLLFTLLEEFLEIEDDGENYISLKKK